MFKIPSQTMIGHYYSRDDTGRWSTFNCETNERSGSVPSQHSYLAELTYKHFFGGDVPPSTIHLRDGSALIPGVDGKYSVRSPDGRTVVRLTEFENNYITDIRKGVSDNALREATDVSEQMRRIEKKEHQKDVDTFRTGMKVLAATADKLRDERADFVYALIAAVQGAEMTPAKTTLTPGEEGIIASVRGLSALKKELAREKAATLGLLGLVLDAMRDSLKGDPDAADGLKGSYALAQFVVPVEGIAQQMRIKETYQTSLESSLKGWSDALGCGFVPNDYLALVVETRRVAAAAAKAHELGLVIEKLASLTATQCSPGNYNYDDYMRGMANGMLLWLAGVNMTEYQPIPPLAAYLKPGPLARAWQRLTRFMGRGL